MSEFGVADANSIDCVCKNSSVKWTQDSTNSIPVLISVNELMLLFYYLFLLPSLCEIVLINPSGGFVEVDKHKEDPLC